MLWDEGANLLLVARSDNELRVLRSELSKRIGQFSTAMHVDLHSEEDRISCIRHAYDFFSMGVDGLVNNAAIQGPIGPLVRNSMNEWVDTIMIDLIASVDMCYLIVPGMLRQGHGKIVNLSGGGATSARPNYSAYATAKTGLVRFSECLAAELAGTGIDVNCVAPGKMPTGMLPEGETVEKDAMQKAAELVVWLLSDESDGITGRLISAVWDDWRHLPDTLSDDLWTLRRVTVYEDGLYPFRDRR